jgi:hypothetical protein
MNTTTSLTPTLLALLREIARAECDGLEYRASPGDAEIRALVAGGLIAGHRDAGRRMAWVTTAAGREMVGECVG